MQRGILVLGLRCPKLVLGPGTESVIKLLTTGDRGKKIKTKRDVFGMNCSYFWDEMLLTFLF